MAVLADSRAAINDTTQPYRISDATLNLLITEALNDVNVWAGTAFTTANLDAAPSPVPLSVRQVTMLNVRVKVLLSDISDPARYAKFVTQDTQYDNSEVQKTLQKVLWNLQKALAEQALMFFGYTLGAVLQSGGDQIGGWKDF